MILVLLAAGSGCGITVPANGQVTEPFWLDGHAGDGYGGDAGAGLDGGASAGTDGVLPGADATSTADGQGPSSEYFVFWNQARVLAHNAAPFGAEWQPSRTTTLGVMRIDWLGNKGQAWMVPCAVHSNEVASSTLTYPSAFIDALAEGPFPMQRDGATLTLPGKTQWLGMLAGYVGDMPDPGDGNHPALTDPDADGHPGATIFINMPFFGDQAIYVAERATTKWTTQRAADGSAVALPLTDGVKVTVGATESILVAANQDKALPDEPPEELRLTPTTAATGCMALMAAPAQFTGISWPP